MIQTEKLNFKDAAIKATFIATLKYSSILTDKEAEDLYDTAISKIGEVFGPSMALIVMNAFSSRLKFDYMLFIKVLAEQQMDEEILLNSGLTEDDIKNLEDYV